MNKNQINHNPDKKDKQTKVKQHLKLEPKIFVFVKKILHLYTDNEQISANALHRL